MKKNKLNVITVYTPTYNRGYCLHQLYESLCRQTCKTSSFEWIIVDDGSTDNTKQLVNDWIEKAPFKITYYKQKNEGKMVKLNFIHQIIDTELCMCVDSDDYLTDDALELILTEWRKASSRAEIAGLVGLDVFKNGNIVGTKFPDSLISIKFRDFEKHGVKGDKKFVYKTSVINSYPQYPSFRGEKFPAPGYLYRLIDVDYNLAIINKPLCIVEYLEDGLSKNKFGQFKKSPNSFMFYRLERMRLATNFNEKFKNAVHYVSSGIFTKRNIFKNNKYILTTILAIPFGISLNVYLRITNKKGKI